MAADQSPTSSSPTPESPGAHSSATAGTASRTTPEAPRRNFVYVVGSVVIGGLVGAVPVLVGIFSFLDPIFGRIKKPLAYAQGDGDGGRDEFIRISALGALEVDGPAQRFPVIADKHDAWN